MSKTAALINGEYPFTWEEAQRAHEAWGMNCGPSALAAVLKRKPDEIRKHLGEFEIRRYMSPTMMADALDSLGVQWSERSKRRNIPASACPACFPNPGLVRIQWTGPWTEPGANGRWAYGHTHWIATWGADCLFDVNCGWTSFENWRAETVALIINTIKRADGGWFATHLLQVNP